ncbi:hypothetical protein ACHQM5_030338 [Ranunculus cassubicifolius]
MKGSTVILVLVTLGLLVAQTHVEAATCTNHNSKKCFSWCRWDEGNDDAYCASYCGCTLAGGKSFPPNDIIHYCKIGCTSSMCVPTTTPQNSADGVGKDKEIVRCMKACSDVCTKRADAALTA